MNQDAQNRFKELIQSYYLAGRSLMVNQLFDMAGINFGYSIELSLKFLLALKGHSSQELMKHTIRKYYKKVVERGYIRSLVVSDDFLEFIDERLNARYPMMISENLARHVEQSRGHVFSIDMLHCYDDFILQLDDALVAATTDPSLSIGFRCCRNLASTNGRIFFHCNDHAFSRIPKYREQLAGARDVDHHALDAILAEPNHLWNFQGLMAYRPWGPKPAWFPASEFFFPKVEEGRLKIRAAQWAANNLGVDLHLSSSNILLPAGTYETQLHIVVAPPNKSEP